MLICPERPFGPGAAFGADSPIPCSFPMCQCWGTMPTEPPPRDPQHGGGESLVLRCRGDLSFSAWVVFMPALAWGLD